MRVSRLILPALLAVLSLPGRAAEIAADYQAGLAGTAVPSPSANGWTSGTPSSDQANFASAAVAPDGTTGFNAWRMLDNSSATSQFITWSRALSTAQHTAAAANGWTLAARLRVADPVASNAGANTVVLLYGNNSAKRWILFFDLNSAGQIVTTMAGGPTVTLTGVDPTLPHEHQLIYSPLSGTAEYLVDGVSKATGYAGTSGSFNGVQWGTGSSGGRGDGYWNSVSFVISDPPSPPAPVVTQHPVSQSVAEGSGITLLSAFSGAVSSYQWYKDTLPVSGGTAASLTLPAITPAHAGDYWCRATNASGSVSTATATLSVLTASGDLVLSEFLAENDSGLRDSDGEQHDWIEIRNTGTVTRSTAGWALTDDPLLPARWPLPAQDIPPGGFLHVWASGKNRSIAGAELHTSFAIRNSGGYLALTRPDNSPAVAFTYPAQSADDSYGLTSHVPPQQKYFSIPSPGMLNADGQTAVKDGITFAPEPGTFSGSVQVTVTPAAAGGTLRCTTDGSRPQFDSPVCTGSVTLSSTTNLRAAVVHAGERYGAAASGAWLKLGADVQTFASPLPVVLLSNHGAGAVPGVTARGPNGDGSEVVSAPLQAHTLTILDASAGDTVLTSPVESRSRAGLKVRGSSSFTFAEKSYTLETWGEHDGEERDVPLLGLPADADWVIYGPDPAQFDSTLIHNTVAFEMARLSGFPAPRFRFVELFLDSGGDITMADHRGLAILMEKPRRGKERIDFNYPSADGTQGGWLISVDRMDALPAGSAPGSMAPRHFHTAGPDRTLQTPDDNPRGYQGILTPGGTGSGSGVTPANDDMPNFYHSFFNFVSPGGWNITSGQRSVIQNELRAFDTALYGTSYTDPVLGYGPHIDVKNWAHHLLLHEFTKNQDAVVLSSYLYREAPGQPIRWASIWDFDRAFDRNTSSGTAGNQALTWAHDRMYYRRLVTDPEFMQAYQDQWQTLRQGPWTNAALTTLVDTQAAEITATVAARSGLTATAWSANLSTMKSWMTTRASAMDGLYTALPVFSHPGGTVTAGMSLTMSAAAGTVYFTTDGTDPRLRGGAVSGAATAYSSALTVNEPLTVTARVRNGTLWSGLRTATYLPPRDFTKLRITEIYYNPPGDAAPLADGDEFEFIELQNTGSVPLETAGLAFTAGIRYTFPADSVIAAGERIVLVRNAAAFTARFPGCTPFGLYSGKLSNGGDAITLMRGDEVLFTMSYDDVAPWPAQADGNGLSLQRPDPAAPGYDVLTWTAAAPTPCAALALTDSDNDGLPDYWEALHGPLAGSADTDGDGSSNAAEFLAGTDYRDSTSLFSLARTTAPAGQIGLEFSALAARSYVVQFSSNLSVWHTLQEVPASASSRTVQLTDTMNAARRYYRVIITAH